MEYSNFFKLKVGERFAIGYHGEISYTVVEIPSTKSIIAQSPTGRRRKINPADVKRLIKL